MALNKATLKNKIETAFKNQLQASKEKNANPDALISELSQSIADAVDQYIRSATIIVPPGQPVQVVVPAGTGATAGPSSPATISWN